jgi:hypothetical protein
LRLTGEARQVILGTKGRHNSREEGHISMPQDSKINLLLARPTDDKILAMERYFKLALLIIALLYAISSL